MKVCKDALGTPIAVNDTVAYYSNTAYPPGFHRRTITEINMGRTRREGQIKLDQLNPSQRRWVLNANLVKY